MAHFLKCSNIIKNPFRTNTKKEKKNQTNNTLRGILYLLNNVTNYSRSQLIKNTIALSCSLYNV